MTTISAGQILSVTGSTVVHYNVVDSGGEQYVYSGGNAIDTTVSSRGLESFGNQGVG
jgi:autotransporter passenger strand-loop-strand repeat protein